MWSIRPKTRTAHELERHTELLNELQIFSSTWWNIDEALAWACCESSCGSILARARPRLESGWATCSVSSAQRMSSIQSIAMHLRCIIFALAVILTPSSSILRHDARWQQKLRTHRFESQRCHALALTLFDIRDLDVLGKPIEGSPASRRIRCDSGRFMCHWHVLVRSRMISGSGDRKCDMTELQIWGNAVCFGSLLLKNLRAAFTAWRSEPSFWWIGCERLTLNLIRSSENETDAGTKLMRIEF